MQKVGPYQVLETIYNGPRPLYKVKAPDGRVLALKTAPLESLSAEMRERFNREAQACSHLDHPNLIRVYDWGEGDAMLYQAMDLLEGGDLAKLFSSTRLLNWDEKLSMMEQFCDGLQYAHDRGLVHRDIKPANIFLENSGRLRILDFGMARVDASTLTQEGAALGTINYMAPEQVRGEKCTRQSDIFSAGIVFYQLATGRHPFSDRHSNIGMVLNAILFQPMPPLSAAAPDAPEGLEFVLSKALEKDTFRRLQSAADLKQALALCRITMKMQPSPQQTQQPKALPADDETTVAIRTPPSSASPAATRGPSPVVPHPVAPVTVTRQPTAPSTVQAPITGSSVEALLCPSCGYANPIGSAFCQQCGQPLTGQFETVEPEPSGAGMTIAIAFVAVGGLLLVVLLILVWMSR
jgi:serine/threonine protein kinase